MAVIMMPPRSEALESGIRDFMAAQQRRRGEREQSRQFDATLALDKQRTDASVAASGAQVVDLGERRKMEERKARFDLYYKQNIEPLMSTGKPEDREAAKKIAIDYIAQDPDLGAMLRPVTAATSRPQTDVDTTTANTNKWKMDSTGRVAAGGLDVQDRNLAMQIATNQQLSAPSFADQQQRQPQAAETKSPYGQTLGILGGRAPDAGERLSANTSVQIAREGNASAERIASQRNASTNQTISNANAPGGEDFLKQIPPALGGLVKKIANYEMDLTKVTSMRGGDRERIAQLVAQYDPTFDMTQYASRAAVRKSFTSGTDAANAAAINTAIRHLDTFAKQAKALSNTSIPAWNKVTNFAIEQTGDARTKNFKTTGNAVFNEMAKVFKGTGATSDSEIKEWRAAVNAADSPEQLQGAIGTMIELMGGRIATMDEKWTRGMGKPRDFKLLDPRSEQILKKLGHDPADIDRVGAGEQTSGQAQYKETATGPNGHKIGSNDGVSWFDVQTGQKVQ